MIRYLQKLKRKKGFTMVELIVVVAIISVIAGIMVPMILHYVTDAKIASANSSASNIKKMVTYYLMELDMKMLGMKRNPNSVAQMIFMCKDGQWIAKAECKTIAGKKKDTDGSLTFYDHKNWWYQNKSFLLLDSTTKDDPNHLLGMTRVVADALVDLRTGFVMCFFQNGECKGVVYIPDCDWLWPGNYGDIPSSITRGRTQARPRIVKSSNTDGSYNCLKEMSPWAGKWPEAASPGIWQDQAGIDRDGFIVGTCPVIKYDADMAWNPSKK